MTLDKAIEILEAEFKDPDLYGNSPEFRAIRLGIKALERFRNLRDAGKDVGMPMLKGETKSE